MIKFEGGLEVSPCIARVSVWEAENEEKIEERKFVAGSKGPIGGIENFSRSS